MPPALKNQFRYHRRLGSSPAGAPKKRLKLEKKTSDVLFRLFLEWRDLGFFPLSAALKPHQEAGDDSG
jgi:hypothetical protein